MATRNGTKPDEVVPKADEAVKDEIGSLQSFNTTSWESFAYGRPKANANGTYSIATKSDAVPLADLIEMRRRDGQTRALLRLFMLPILSCLKEAEWVAPEWAEQGAEEEVDFANKMFRLPPAAGGMTSSLDSIMRYTLLAILEGFSAFEEVRHIPEKGPLKGKITLRKLAHRDAKTVKFAVDDHGGYAGFTQTFKDMEGNQKSVFIGKTDSWYYTANAEENPFYGVSYFETAWYHYDIKVKLYYIAHIAAQFAAVPGRIGKFPQGAAAPQRMAFGQALANFAFNTSMTIPENFSVEFAKSNSAGFDFKGLIDHHARMQSKSVLMQFADNDERMVLIDNGKADASADMFVKALESIMDQIAESWTVHMMPKYIDWNFDSGLYPVFRFGKLSDQARDNIKDIFTVVVTSGMLNCTPEFVRELEKKLAVRLGLDINYEEIEKHEAEQAELMAEQQALQAEMEALGGAPADPNAPAGAPPAGAPKPGPGAAGPPPARTSLPSGPAVPGSVPLSGPEVDPEVIDGLYAMAQNLFLARPQSGVIGLDDSLGITDEKE